MNNIFIGIDLGTTNSAIATFDGEIVNVIPNSFGENLTPSVVRIDRRGDITVGRQAYRYLDNDPANTRSEFKRLMGTEARLEFNASGSSFLPEELSARILTSLLADAADVLGFTPEKAVISTPALFELPQNHATMRAGKLAGLKEVLLIQEPVASAIAAGWREDSPGMWLVFDLGGGTLDISLLETHDGRLRVVDHSGDNFLGGKDFDNALADWALDRLREDYGIPGLQRENPDARPLLTRLKNACEHAKIELSRMERTSIVIPGLCTDAAGCQVNVDLEVTRAEYEGLITPLVGKALAACLLLIEKCSVSPDDIGRVVFVGGPTQTPYVRRVIGDKFGGRVATGIDPMTAVARGAALYAATSGLEGRPEQGSGLPQGGLALRVEHPPVTTDLEPFVVGRFLPQPGEELPVQVQLHRDDGFTSNITEVGAEGTFVLQTSIREHCRNEFTVIATGADGMDITLATPNFTIVHGISISDPPLSRSVGVALADNSVHVYFKKGTALPARKTFVHQTVRHVSGSDTEDALSVPIIQGEFHRAHRNCLIGTLAIGGVGCTLPADTRVEVTLQLDRSGQMHARADIPSIGRTFDNVVHILVPTASIDTLEQGLVAAESRSNSILRRVFRDSNSKSARDLEQALLLIAEAKRSLKAAQGGDDDAGQRLRRLLPEIEGIIDGVEEKLEWPEMLEEATDMIEIAISWVSSWGTKSEQALLDQAISTARAASGSRDALELERQVRTMRNLANAAYARDPRSVFRNFDWYTENIASATDIARAAELLDKGRQAVRQGDAEALKSINRQLYHFFPGTEEERRKSFGSGVR